MSTSGAGMLRTPVLVAGRGPVGMTFALRLAGFGVPSLIVDPAGWTVDKGSKALCMQQESMEILDRVGVGKVLGAEGVYWPLGRTYHRGREVAQVRFPPAPRVGFPPFVNYPQRDTEALLIEKLREESLVSKRLGWRIAGITQDEDGLTAVIEGEGGRAVVRADHVVGCDGARSTVRKQLGFGFDGTSYTANFLLCDIRAKLDFPNERRLFFDPPFNPGRTVLVHPCPNDVWHIDWQVGAEPVDVEAERASGGIDRRVRSITGDRPYELLWLTTYTFRSLKADSMRRGRAFLAGDAAHLFAPYGARGLNSGLADAEALAWRLAAVRNGASPDILDGYDRERLAAARENFEITDTTARFMAPPTRRARIRRAAILHGSRFAPGLRRHINAGRFYQPARLPGTPEGALEGMPLPDVAAAADGKPGRLRDLVGGGVLLLLAGDDAEAVAGALAADAGERPLPLVAAVLRTQPGSGSTDSFRRLVAKDIDIGPLRVGMEPGHTRAIVVRPDGYVARILDSGHAGQLADRLRDAVDGLFSISEKSKGAHSNAHGS